MQDGDEVERVGKKVFRHDKLKHMKKRSIDDKRKSATVRELLKDRRIELDMSIPPELDPEEKQGMRLRY